MKTTSARCFRFVSFLPAATEIIALLGATEFLDGRSHECDCPPEITDLHTLTRAKISAPSPAGKLTVR
jgi:iron complex transport system substrate-binding protein